jgi:hypothetical protein
VWRCNSVAGKRGEKLGKENRLETHRDSKQDLKMARPARFELATLCLEGRRSIQLSYGRL